jgi:hypothetical protein
LHIFIVIWLVIGAIQPCADLEANFMTVASLGAPQRLSAHWAAEDVVWLNATLPNWSTF